MTIGPKHRISSWCMLAAICLAFVVLVAIGIYAIKQPDSGPQPLQRQPASEPSRSPALAQ